MRWPWQQEPEPVQAPREPPRRHEWVEAGNPDYEMCRWCLKTRKSHRLPCPYKRPGGRGDDWCTDEGEGA